MLILQDLQFTSPSGKIILNKLNLQVNPGEFVVVIGSNGSGKSTLLNLIAGFKKPTQGKIFIDAKDVTYTSQFAKSDLVSKVMQDPNIGTMANMTIFENIVFALKRGSSRGLMPFNTTTRREIIEQKLAILAMGLEHRLEDLVANLSGGQRQALSLIMAIISKAKILLLDEITAALDPHSAENVMQIATRIIHQEKLTCIMVTHNMEQAIRYGDRTLLLADGIIVQEFKDKKHLTPEKLMKTILQYL